MSEFSVGDHVQYCGARDFAGRITTIVGRTIKVFDPVDEVSRAYDVEDLQYLDDIRGRKSYLAFVDMVARNNVERDGSAEPWVAESVLTATTKVGDEWTRRMTFDPYADEPSGQTRIWPKDVLLHAEDPILSGGTLRDAASQTLVRDLREQMESIDSSSLETEV